MILKAIISSVINALSSHSSDKIVDHLFKFNIIFLYIFLFNFIFVSIKNVVVVFFSFKNQDREIEEASLSVLLTLLQASKVPLLPKQVIISYQHLLSFSLFLSLKNKRHFFLTFFTKKIKTPFIFLTRFF